MIFKLSVSDQSSTCRNIWKQNKQHVEHAKLILYTNVSATLVTHQMFKDRYMNIDEQKIVENNLEV
jgi:hypothetical protein